MNYPDAVELAVDDATRAIEMKSSLTLTMYLVVLAVLASSLNASTAKNKPDHLLVDGKKAPLIVHSIKPRLSWHSNVVSQAFYQIQVVHN